MIIINFYILRNINIQPQHTIILKHIHESDRERFIITARGSKFINKLLWLLLVVCLIIHVVFLHVLVRIGDSALHVTWLQLCTHLHSWAVNRAAKSRSAQWLSTSGRTHSCRLTTQVVTAGTSSCSWTECDK